MWANASTTVNGPQLSNLPGIPVKKEGGGAGTDSSPGSQTMGSLTKDQADPLWSGGKTLEASPHLPLAKWRRRGMVIRDVLDLNTRRVNKTGLWGLEGRR